jgi:hypothetical protein
MNKFTGIKKILREQVKSGVHTFWAHIEDKNGKTLEFRQLYNTVPDDVSEVYSPKQLLDKLINLN